MIQDTGFIGSELRRLEEALLAYTPGRQWQIVTVAFPSTPGQEIDIPHTLSPGDPEHVDWVVLQSTSPVLVYKDGASNRVPWGPGFIRLRATTPSVQVVLGLSVAADDSDGRVTPAGTMQNFYIPRDTATGSYTGLGATGKNGVWDATGTIENGVDIVNLTANWQIGLEYAGPEQVLHIHDITNGVTPVQVRHALGAYHLQPGQDSKRFGAMVAHLGNPNAAAKSGYWNGVYATQYFRSDFSAAQGEPLRIPFNAAEFVGSGGAWTVAAGNITTDDYTIVGRRMFYEFDFESTTVAAGATVLTRALPAGIVVAKETRSLSVQLIDNGVLSLGMVRVGPGGTTIEFYKDGLGAAYAGAGVTTLRGQFSFFIQ